MHTPSLTFDSETTFSILGVISTNSFFLFVDILTSCIMLFVNSFLFKNVAIDITSKPFEIIKTYLKREYILSIMSKEKFLLVSLKENKAKKLAQVVSNESCRLILDYLAEKEATETELAKKLNIPISTIHYNLKHLTDAGLVIVEEFHYSEKGKEVNHYKLANKYIIIAPKTTFGIKEKLKTILPVALLIAAGAGFIQIFSKYFVKGGFTKQLTKVTRTIRMEAVAEAEGVVTGVTTTVAEGAVAVAEEAIPLADKLPEMVQNVTNVTTATTTTTIPPSPFANIALWFLIGAFFAIVLYLIISKIREK